jgi:hypothetical protein
VKVPRHRAGIQRAFAGCQGGLGGAHVPYAGDQAQFFGSFPMLTAIFSGRNGLFPELLQPRRAPGHLGLFGG